MQISLNSWFWLSNGPLDSSYETTEARMSKMFSLFLIKPGTPSERIQLRLARYISLPVCSPLACLGPCQKIRLVIGPRFFLEEVFQETKAEASRLLMTLQITPCHFTLILWIHRDSPYSLWESLNTRRCGLKMGWFLGSGYHISAFESLIFSIYVFPWILIIIILLKIQRKKGLLSWFWLLEQSMNLRCLFG